MIDVVEPNDQAIVNVVGLGASAGGLEPLRQLLARVPQRSGLAFIVVQHLDPTQDSLLGDLLQSVTSMPVVVALEATVVMAEHVYVIAPNSELSLVGGRLHLALPHQPRGQRLPINTLFESLALSLGSRAVGVVLSGLGADGTLGLQAIARRGGFTLAQEPLSAQFDSMPAHAIASGAVHCVLPPQQMAEQILRWLGGLHIKPLCSAPPVMVSNHVLSAIVTQLRMRHGHDFSGYKVGTLERRLTRRMMLHRLATMADYEAHLRQNPHELDLLFKEILIGVTSFFRDGPLWQELQDLVLRVLLERCTAQRSADDVAPVVLRAWVVGCSTGEEAYCLAMVFNELLDSQPASVAITLRIFATDLNADAIAFARKGLYPARIAQEVSAARLTRFFRPHPNGYSIAPELRTQVLFAQHNVAQDPPFIKLDLLCCRNLLIYFDISLQQRLLTIFHYSLRPGGALWLGRAEAAWHAQELFAPVRQHARLYWRLETQTTGNVCLILPTNPSRHAVGAQQEPIMLPPPITHPVNLQALADQLVLQVVAPASVLVTSDGDILYVSGSTGRWLEPAAGKANWNLHAMARPGIRAQLACALRQAQSVATPIELSGLAIDDHHDERVDIIVRQVIEPAALAGMLLVVFKPAAVPVNRRRRSRSTSSIAATALSNDLALALAEVRALRDEINATREQMQAAVEELQSSNEELQASNEELTTAKEESQSMNEELQTINAELHAKLDELALAQSDMQNLLNSTDIATLFLDKGLNVRRFTTQISRIFQLRDSDIGRPLAELASTLDYPQMHADVMQVLLTLAPIGKAVSSSDGQSYSVRIVPYRTLNDSIQGVVMTFVDITPRNAPT